MRRLGYILWVIFCLFAFFQNANAQEDIFEDLLKEEVEVVDPQYKPVIGVGVGTLNFFGEVSNNYYSPLMGNAGVKVNVATYIDSRNHYYRANFYLLYGSLTGEKTSYNIPEDNLNFKSTIIDFGINVLYNFGHLYEKEATLTPFIALGIESVQFNSKRDSLSSEDIPYHYWSDGTIRNVSEADRYEQAVINVERDYFYETDLRDEIDYGLGKYPQNAFAIPINLGLDYKVSERVALRLGYSYNFLLSDRLDHVTSENTQGVIGDKKKDKYSYAYLELHLDLFSDPKTITIEKLFADIEFDYTMYGDEDNDMIWDGWDECPDTPKGVNVDSLGCPYDGDMDGIPNYLDKELNTPNGAYVDKEGVQMTEDELVALLNQSSNAVDRKDVDLYIRKIEGYGQYFGTSNMEIPDKFKSLDIDWDGYISFDELLKSIDDFFDFESQLSPEDIYELNSFFFAQ